MNSDNLSKNTNRSVTIMLHRIKIDDKLKRHTEKLPKEGYMARAVREFCSDLKDVKHNDPDL